MPVTVQASGNYEVSNGLVAIRVPASIPDLIRPLAPIQGIKYRDGTWTGTGPNYIAGRLWYEGPSPTDPCTRTVVTVREQTAQRVVIDVDYFFEKAPFDWSHVGIFLPGGPGFHRTRVTVTETDAFVEEHGDVDFGYQFNVNVGLDADQARYRGHHATALKYGREINGSVYGSDEGWHRYVPMDAVMDLVFDKPYQVSYGTNEGEVGWRPPMATWNPWVVDSGWYWQVYNAAAPSTANLFGIYAGPASRLIGCNSCGAGIYNRPGTPNEVGVTVAINRIGPDLSVSTENRFVWGIFVSTKADLPADPQIVPPIGVVWNRVGGLATKMAVYQADFADPVGGYGTLYMGREAIGRLKDRVRNDFDEYQRVYNLDPTIRPIIDLWRSDELAPVVDHVKQLAADLVACMTTGEGIYLPRFVYIQGGHEMIRAILFIDQALDRMSLTPADRLSLKRAARLFASVLWDDDFVPFSGAFGGNYGTGNMPIQHQGFRDVYALYLNREPEFTPRASGVVERARSALFAAVNEHGAASGSTNYIGANVAPTFNIMLAIQSVGLEDLFAEPRMAKLGEYFIALNTPPEVRFGGPRKWIAFGDAAEVGSDLVGILASGLRSSNPTIASKVHGAWVEQGAVHGGFFGSSLLMIDESAPSAAPSYVDAEFPGALKVFRGKEGARESALWLIDGTFYRDHRGPDQGHVSIYLLGVPASLGPGSIYYPHIPGALWRSTVQPASEIADWWGQPNLPYNQGNFWPTSTGQFGRFIEWDRVIKMPEVGGRRVVACRDQPGFPYTWNLNLMVDQVTPPSGPVILPPEHPLAPVVGSLPAGVHRWRLRGLWSSEGDRIDYDLWIVAAGPFDWSLGAWKHEWHYGVEMQQFEATNGYPFVERQVAFRIRASGRLKWALIPYPASTPWTGTVVDTPTGLGFTGGIQDVGLAALPDLTEVVL